MQQLHAHGGEPAKGKKRSRSKNAPQFDAREQMLKMCGVDITRIDGIDISTALTVVSKTGMDLSRFPSGKHFASWLGLCPETRISGGKVLGSGTKHSVNRATQAFKQAAAALRTSPSALGAYYRRLCIRMDKAKAVTAAAHKLARLFYALLSYTDDEIDSVFAAELFDLDRQQIRDWYNGYNWLGTRVYNPFDALLLFDTREFRAYWFETGTPDFLVQLLLQRRTFTPDLGRIVASESLLSTFDVDTMPIEALLFQTGYLTIDSVRRLPGMTQFTLCYPNLEVRSSLNGALLERFSHDPARQSDLAPQLYDLLLACDFDGMKRLFTAFYFSIPNQWFVNNHIADYEGYYASVFYSYFAALGLDVDCEKSSSVGRLDMAVRLSGQIFLFEFKVVELEPDGRALQQIKDKGYARPYLALGQPIHQIGVEFSKASRTVVGFEVETLHVQCAQS